MDLLSLYLDLSSPVVTPLVAAVLVALDDSCCPPDPVPPGPSCLFSARAFVSSRLLLEWVGVDGKDLTLEET